MRIVSKFKDYYDKAMGEGVDRSLTYIRQRVELTPREFEEKFHGTGMVLQSFHSVYRSYNIDNWRIYSFAVGFCGKLYPALRIEIGVGDNDVNGFPQPLKVIFAYSVEDVDDYVLNHYSKEGYEQYYNGPEYNRKNHYKFTNWNSDFVRSRFVKYFEHNKHNIADHKIWSTYTTPTFTHIIGDFYANNAYVINDALHKYQFINVMPPFQAYQEISMFLGGMAVPSKPMPVIPDVLKDETHGFNKYSFRKEKSKK
jgi:hypothetical protein